MGQPNSTEAGDLDARETVKYQEFVKNYQFLRKIKDPRYGEISILQDKYTKELVALRELLSKSAKDFERDMISLRSRYKISHPNIIKVLGYTSKSEDNFCASIHKILMIVEYLDNDLEKEISLKKNQANYYKEEQLWYLIENVVKALSTLQKNEISHEDLKPSGIFISKMGVYKIAQHNIAGNAMPAYHQRMTGLTDGRTYLSPALLTNLQTSEVRPQHNPWKSDVFSLGMTILHAATLTNCEKLYNWNNFTLDLEELGERIASLRPRYSERFQDLIQTMLDLRENSRPDFLALESKLSTASESNERGNPTPGHSPLRPRANEEHQDIPDDGYEDIGHYRQNIKQNLVRATPQDETGPYLQKNVANPIFKGENRIAPLRSDENYSSVESGQHSKRTLPQDTTKTVDPRAPNFWNNARANEPVSHNLREVGGHDLYNRPNNLQNQQQAAAVMAHERVFDKGYGFLNRDEPSEFAVKSRSTNTIDQSHGLYQAQRSEARTQVSSITNIHNEQQQGQGQNAKMFESNDNLRKSLISDEVARIMSDFRSKMGIHASEAGYAHDSLYKNQKENIRGYDDSGYNKDIYGGESKYKGAAGYSENLPLSSQPVVNAVFHANTNYTTFAQQESVKMAPRDFKEERGFQPGSSYEHSKDFMYGNYQNKPETHALTDRSLNFANQQASTFNAGYEQSQQTYYNNQDFKQQDISSQPWEQQYTSHSQSRNDPFMSQALKSEPSVQAWDQQYVKQVESNPQYNYYNGQTSLAHNYGGQQQNLHVAKDDLYSQNYTSIQSHGQSVDAYAQNREKSPEAYYDYEAKQPENPNVAAYSSVNSAQNRLSPAGPTESELVNESYPDGSVYEGSKVNGLRHGKGTFYYADGGVYDGDWIEGSMEGYGLLYYSSGAKAYEGEWKEDKFHGRGAVYNEMPAQLMEGFDFTNFDNVGDYWMSYEGDFFNDNKEGNGVLLLSNGERFEGQFKEDMVDGIGAYYMADGRVIKGEWWQNKLVKPIA